MSMFRHPLTKVEYLRQEDRCVLVTGPDGVSGVFDRKGNWISGKRRIADAALCYWVARAPEVPPPRKGVSVRMNEIDVNGETS